MFTKLIKIVEYDSSNNTCKAHSSELYKSCCCTNLLFFLQDLIKN